MFAAVAGVLTVTGLASAQSPPPGPLPLPVPPTPAYRMALPATAQQQVRPASGTTYVQGSGGCANCNNGAASGGYYGHQPGVQYGTYGPGRMNGCGNLKSDLGFMYGSCKSFFDPCGPLPLEFGRHKQKCPLHPYATPYGTPYNGCCVDTYLNH